MINSEKIGIGIVTYNRPHLLKKLLDSIQRNDIELIVVNDGEKFEFPGYNYYIHNNETNLGVGKSKNKALRYLLSKECEHIFLIEDDIFIKNPLVFEKYIEASKISGIQHFNYSQHGIMNKKFYEDNSPNPRFIINYGPKKHGSFDHFMGNDEINISLYPHCVGAFSYYSKKCLENVGLIDERYYNVWEHVDHTYEIIKAGMHPPFWFFADIDRSWEYLGDEPWDIKKSTISSNPNHQQMMKDADKIFIEKHGCPPTQIPINENLVGSKLKEIRKKYGRSDNSYM